MADDDRLLLRVEEAARLLDISRGLAYELIARGELPSVRLGRLVRIPRHALEMWLDRQAGLPTVPPEDVSFAQQSSHSD